MTESRQTNTGDFYAISEECIHCGVPQHAAPDLVGYDANGNCTWVKQPVTEGEMRRACAVFAGACCGAHRYRGHDPLIQIRVGSENCDHLDGPLAILRRSATPFSAAFWRRITTKRR